MTAAWAGICCSQPPCAYVSLRKATYTYDNLMKRKAFTISFPSEDYVKEADFFGIASGHDSDKFQSNQPYPSKKRSSGCTLCERIPDDFGMQSD